ncbi:MAG: MarR family transcriptional regulator [Saprospiraceae bacterium]|nr:MarR family transcriptional regulator [Saprospiraceae bacterium]
MEVRTVYLAKRIETEITVKMSKALVPFELTPIQFAVLSFVPTNNQQFSSAQLSRRFGMTPQSMNQIVHILLQKDLLIKTTDPAHKRILRLSLTELGKTILKDCNAAINEVESNLFGDLTEEEHLIYRNLIGKILNKTRSK